jgi:ATP-binding cassette subfamily F protein uup
MKSARKAAKLAPFAQAGMAIRRRLKQNAAVLATPTAIVTVQHVSKAFGTRRVLTDASLAVHEDDRIGLVGVNGSGKSTLMKMLVAGAAFAGVSADEALLLAPDDGLVTWKQQLRLEYVPQEPQLPTGATVAAALERGASDAIAPHQLRELAAALGVPPMDAGVDHLSIGERRRVALCRALVAPTDLLALDEPTNHLDARTIEWLEGHLERRPGALLLVTHDRYFLDRVVSRIIEVDRGRLHSYDGDYRTFLLKQAARLEHEAGRERERASFVRREIEWIRRGAPARTTKQQARIDRFEAAVAAEPGAQDRRSGPMSLRLPTGGRLGKTILELRSVSKSVGVVAGQTPSRRLFHDLTLTMKPGDRIGIVGPNGAGKTTLVRTILGELAPDSGEVVVGVNTRFAFLDQGRAELDDARTVLEEVAGDNDHVVLEDGPIHVRTFLRQLLFDDGFADTPVGTLSGGERSRVQLAKLLRRGGNLLVLDEPTNDLDLVTLGVLEDALTGFPGCALVVSHDRWFLDRVVTGILAFEGDGEVQFYEGDYSTYLDKHRARVAAAASGSTVAPALAAAPTRRERERPRTLSFKERSELAGMEAAIEAAERKVVDLESTLSDPKVFRGRPAEVPALVAALDAARAEVDKLYGRWQELDAIAKASPP